MNYDNYIAKAEIAMANKKILVLEPITFKSCSIFQKILKSIKNLLGS